MHCPRICWGCFIATKRGLWGGSDYAAQKVAVKAVAPHARDFLAEEGFVYSLVE